MRIQIHRADHIDPPTEPQQPLFRTVMVLVLALLPLPVTGKVLEAVSVVEVPARLGEGCSLYCFVLLALPKMQ